MNDITIIIKDLEDRVAQLKNELRRIKSTINKLEKLALLPPTELIVKKEKVEVNLKEFKQKLKALKKVVQLLD